MYTLDKTYGFKAYREWTNDVLTEDLSDAKTSTQEANMAIWKVDSFRELGECISFLGAMNKRLILYYRGQGTDTDPYPVLFRDHWYCFETGQRIALAAKADIAGYWKHLQDLGPQVYEICKKIGIPRFRGMRDYREIQWAVIQHYGIWPTPLIDVTSSLLAAATFAMVSPDGKPRKKAYLYVVGLPHTTGPITYSSNEDLVLARLQSCCPPIAKRPHCQEGFLVGRFPMYDHRDKKVAKSNLVRRLVAKFELNDAGKFWDSAYKPIPSEALMPSEDTVLDAFKERFGSGRRDSVEDRALSLVCP